MSGGTTQSAAGSQFRHNAFMREMANRQSVDVKRELRIGSESDKVRLLSIQSGHRTSGTSCTYAYSQYCPILRYPNFRIVESFKYPSIDVSGWFMRPCVLRSCSIHARTRCRARCWDSVMANSCAVVNTELRITSLLPSYFISCLFLSITWLST